MRIVILTKTLIPGQCGIGDHTIEFSKALRLKGYQVTIIAGEGLPDKNHQFVRNYWLKQNIAEVFKLITSLNPDHLVLQYTPLMYAIRGNRQNFELADFWGSIFSSWQTSLILHESYFKSWWHPTSMIKGQIEKHLLQRMALKSHYVFTASQPLCREVEQWGNPRATLLPIGSNLDFNPIDRSQQRNELGIGDDEIVLTLFGGGNGIRKLSHYVSYVDETLVKHGYSAYWLLLGGVKNDWFSLKLPVFSPGFLERNALSNRLQLSDIVLAPQISGLSAKRGTLIAAMQHGLPVIGTRGTMTDAFWRDARGILLIPMPGKQNFADAVLKLVQSTEARKEMGGHNLVYHNTHFTWDIIASKFLNTVSKP